MSDSRDRRNYEAGRRLDNYKTRTVLAKRTVAETGRGSSSIEQIRSGLASLAITLKRQGITYLERATSVHMRAWAQDLKSRLADEEISRATTSSYISAVNQAMRAIGREDLLISAGDFGLSRGRKWDNREHGNTLSDQKHFRAFLADRAAEVTGKLQLRLAGLGHSVALQENLGLRLRESALLKIADKKILDGRLELHRDDGTKNGRGRMSTVADPDAVASAHRFVMAHADIYKRGSLVPAEMSWREYRAWAYDVIDAYRDAYPERVGYRYHGNRHSYAQQRFRTLFRSRTGVCLEPPCCAGLYGGDWFRDAAEKCGMSQEAIRAMDKEIRLEISADLGHSRKEITNSYLGR
jgi:hypothetical protein